MSDHLPQPLNPRPWTPRVLALIDGPETIEAVVDHLFARGGPLEQAGLSYRPQQHALAQVVARRLDRGDGWALGEAPCGVGKGQAYLIPGVISILRARGRWKPDPAKKNSQPPRMIVSTANIALQGQLVEKDVPLIASALGIRVRVGLLKGRSNYICDARLNESLLVRFSNDGGYQDLTRLRAHLDADPDGSGDRDALPFQVSPSTWARASTDSAGCPQAGCGHFEPSAGYTACRAETAKRAAVGAEVLVVNHHYLALAGPGLATGRGSLLAIDEAHALEGALRGALSKDLRRGTAFHLGRICAPVYGNDARKIVGDPVLRLLDRAKDWLRSTSAAQVGRRPLPPGWAGSLTEQAFEPLKQAADALDLLAKAKANTEEEIRAAARAEAACEQVRGIHGRCLSLLAARPSPAEVSAAPGPWAMWAEQDGEYASLGYCPADVSSVVARLQKVYPSGVLVSATLDVEATVTALGLQEPLARPAAEVVTVGSPFPLAQLGLLVVPSGPGVKDPLWTDWASKQIVEAVRQSGGGALVLCSSRRMMDEAVDALRGAGLPQAVLAQGESGRADLRDRFIADVDSVLVGTKSFFEGLDVQGDACRLVVIDKIPFDAPGDPVEDAVGLLAAERSGGSPFLVRSLPRACALLAQAAGRLVRSPTDRGAVVLLDQRVAAGSSIGGAARRALPPFPTSRDIADVGRHLRGEPVRSVAPSAPFSVNGRVESDGGESIPLRRRA